MLFMFIIRLHRSILPVIIRKTFIYRRVVVAAIIYANQIDETCVILDAMQKQSTETKKRVLKYIYLRIK